MEDLFNAVAGGEIQGITSELSLAECLVKPIADGNPEARSAYESALRSCPKSAAVELRNVFRNRFVMLPKRPRVHPR